MPSPPPPIPKFEWERLIAGLPPGSPLWAHDLCGHWCSRKDGSRLAPKTLAVICYALAIFASEDGTAARPGIKKLTLAAKSHRATVIASLAHLERVGLIYAVSRGGRAGVPRHYVTVYQLTVPDLGAVAPVALERLPVPEAETPIAWFHPHHAPRSALHR